SRRSQQRGNLVQSLPDRDPQPKRQYQNHDRRGRSAEPRLGGTRTERSEERRIMGAPGTRQQNLAPPHVIGFLRYHIGLTPAQCSLVPQPPINGRATTPSGLDRRAFEQLGKFEISMQRGGASEDAYPRRTGKIGAPERSRTPNPQIRIKRWVRAILRHV